MNNSSLSGEVGSRPLIQCKAQQCQVPSGIPKSASSWEGSTLGAFPPLWAPVAWPAGPKARNLLPRPELVPARKSAVGFCSSKLKNTQHPPDGSREWGMGNQAGCMVAGHFGDSGGNVSCPSPQLVSPLPGEKSSSPGCTTREERPCRVWMLL